MSITINGTSGISGVDGSAATPALQGSDSNTGISFGADTVNVNTGGSTRATVDSSGRVGIGTASPGRSLEIGTSQPAIKFNNGTDAWTIGTGAFIDGSDSLCFFEEGVGERMRITNSGQILVNRISPASAERLSVQAIGSNDAIFVDSPSGGTGYVYRSAAASGTAAYFIANNAQAGLISITSSSTSYLSGSDYRLKTDVRSIADPCEKLLALKPVAFTWLADDSYGESFIAHELQEVYPYAVSGTKDAVDDKGNPAYQCIDQSKLVPLLTAALQEAIAKIETQGAAIAALETRLTALEGGAAQ